ncbi:reverse transcriptase domain-containing protein [Tanacetum coccineum]
MLSSLRAKENSKTHGSYSRMDRHAWTGRAQASSSLTRKEWNPHSLLLKFLIVAIDYFTKWIEAKAVATITGNQVKRFVWDNIECRFGLPGEIVSDNGKQFCDNSFKDWCARLSIT